MAIKVNRKTKQIDMNLNDNMDSLKNNEEFKGIVKDTLVSAGIPVVDNPNFVVVVDPLLEQELIRREQYLKDKEHLKQINKDLKKFVLMKGVPKIQIGEFIIELNSESVDVAKIPDNIREKYLETKVRQTIEITKVKNEVGG